MISNWFNQRPNKSSGTAVAAGSSTVAADFALARVGTQLAFNRSSSFVPLVDREDDAPGGLCDLSEIGELPRSVCTGSPELQKLRGWSRGLFPAHCCRQGGVGER